MTENKDTLMFSTLGRIFSGKHTEIFLLFSPENRFDIACNLSPMETNCMQCQILFSGKKIRKSAELAQRVGKIKEDTDSKAGQDLCCSHMHLG